MWSSMLVLFRLCIYILSTYTRCKKDCAVLLISILQVEDHMELFTHIIFYNGCTLLLWWNAVVWIYLMLQSQDKTQKTKTVGDSQWLLKHDSTDSQDHTGSHKQTLQCFGENKRSQRLSNDKQAVDRGQEHHIKNNNRNEMYHEA